MADIDVVVVASELSKLRKQDLIDFIIHNTLPENVSSDVLLKYTKKSRNVCEKCSETLDSTVSSGDSAETVMESGENSRLEITYLKELCVQKDIIIRNQQVTIETLVEQKNLLNNVSLLFQSQNLVKSPIVTPVEHEEIRRIDGPRNLPQCEQEPIQLPASVECSVNKSARPSGNAVLKTQRRKQMSNTSNTTQWNAASTTNHTTDGALTTTDIHAGKEPASARNLTSLTELSRAVLEAEQQQKLKEIIHLNDDDSHWQKVSYKRKDRNKPTLVGTGLDICAGGLKAVPSLTYFHVYQLDPKTKDSDLMLYLKTMFSEVTCERLDSKYPDIYASFKVGIFDKNIDNFLKPNIWPEGTKINKFFHIRKNPQKGI